MRKYYKIMKTEDYYGIFMRKGKRGKWRFVKQKGFYMAYTTRYVLEALEELRQKAKPNSHRIKRNWTNF